MHIAGLYCRPRGPPNGYIGPMIGRRSARLLIRAMILLFRDKKVGDDWTKHSQRVSGALRVSGGTPCDRGIADESADVCAGIFAARGSRVQESSGGWGSLREMGSRLRDHLGGKARFM